MFELTLGIVAFLVGAAAGVAGSKWHEARLEAQRKSAAYRRRVETRRRLHEERKRYEGLPEDEKMRLEERRRMMQNATLP